MQLTRTLTLVVLCVGALCCVEAGWAANSVTDSSGRVWCVRSEASPTEAIGEEIYLFDEGETFGEFITADKAHDTTPHVFLTPTGTIGIVWSRENCTTCRMEICTTTFDQASGLWAHPFTILTSPQGDVDHTEPRMEISRAGTAHLIYVATSEVDGISVYSLIYRINEDGIWFEPSNVSSSDETVEFPELFLGASEQGYPLVLVYLSSPQLDSSRHLVQGSRSQTLIALKRNAGDPDPWAPLSRHRIPINLR